LAMKRGRGGVEYEDVKVGEGASADRGTKVEVRYDLFLNRGQQIQQNQHYSFRVGKRRLIPGLEYGVEGMRVGGERRLRVAPHLAYRDQDIPGIVPERAVLEFYVTLLRVEAGGHGE
jgi:FKBP-type peptidyl-prolyl cis-trans isomerase